MTTLSTLINTYPTLSWRDRLHMQIRWRVCPLPAIAARVPTQDVVVDLGCGHGLFAQLLARESADRQVIGVDLDAHKIAVAEPLTRQLRNLRFIAGDVAQIDIPPAQAITILDVFYLVPFAIQERLLSVCADRLARGGVIVLKEMAERPRWKVWLNWLEETLAVRVLKITASDGSGQFYFRPRAEWQALFNRLGFTVETIPMDRGYYHPHVVFVARKRG
ncbi:MAG: class I SAM-dependent methyltransferase [Anaerolineae bacterium]|nr:class I SAM-dependent methyltransferase [Anaerolineae bacterium]